MDFEDLFSKRQNHHGHRDDHHDRHEQQYSNRHDDSHENRHGGMFMERSNDHHKTKMDLSALMPMVQKLLANKPLLIAVVLGAFLLLGITLALTVFVCIFAYKLVLKSESLDWHAIIETLLKFSGLAQVLGG